MAFIYCIFFSGVLLVFSITIQGQSETWAEYFREHFLLRMDSIRHLTHWE